MKAKPKNFEAVLEALRNGNTRRSAAHAAGINQSTIFEWLKNPILSEHIKKAESDAELEMVKIVRTQAKKTWTAAAWWLERKNPKNWGKREQTDLNHKGNIKLDMPDIEAALTKVWGKGDDASN
jgi:hypothetical protein